MIVINSMDIFAQKLPAQTAPTKKFNMQGIKVRRVKVQKLQTQRFSLKHLANCFIAVFLAISCPAQAQQSPNIVLLLADDLGFSDIGSFGSEISTPNLDSLAARGVRFTNYHTASSCAPTRAMLMSGLSSHQAGLGNMPESLAPEMGSSRAYAGYLLPELKTVADQLAGQGYRNYMVGKWHLGATPDTLPSARGFHRTYALADTGADNFEQRPYLPIYEQANWYEDGQRTTLPDDFYSSKTLIDKTIEYIDSNTEQPFFAYVAFQAVHIPVQAPKEYTNKYADTYQNGWHELRQQRYQRAIETGVVPAGLNLTDMHTTEDWQSLSEEERAYEAKSMAVYAGMIDAMDEHIGRLIAHLKATGRYDNTVFIFTSDNGAEPTDTLAASTPFVPRKYFEYWLDSVNYRTDFETLGEKGSYNMIGDSFASAAVSPLSLYKFFNSEGGMRVPLIYAAPDSVTLDKTNAFAFATDLVPTILELAGAAPLPNTEGKSLVPLVKGEVETIREQTDTVGFELGGNAAFFKGDYKLLLNRGPVGDDRWHLYNIIDDPTEQVDLKKELPELFAEMQAGYQDYAEKHGVLAVPEGYDQRMQVGQNMAAAQLRKASPYLLVIGVVTVVLVVLFIRRKRRAA
jgi:arylsulfatase/uncharacterized sulfatase